jgi:YkoY family integral membrane protein
MTTQDFLAIGFLVVMEGLLSFDNALALAAMVSHLPEVQRKRALTYGMIGAFVFRLSALMVIEYLMESAWVKWVGGGYLIYLAVQHFFGKENHEEQSGTTSFAFWRCVVMVELTDIAFSMDSILAAVAVSPKIWVVATGGILGIIMMRFAAVLFIKLIAKYPNLEHSAYGLVFIVGMKLLIEACQVWAGAEVLDFESCTNPAFWVLWVSMAVSLGAGFYESTGRGVRDFK